MRLIYTILIILFALSYSLRLLAQTEENEYSLPSSAIEQPLSLDKKGVVFEHEPSNFKMHFRFRMQNRITFEDLDEDGLKSDTLDFAVRRMRMRFEGNALDSRLLYRFQFAFTRADMDYDTNNYPNVLRDAAIGWRVNPKGQLWFGQAKLPGNRQRVISSGEQEFVDRSLLNATFNLDRDQGIQYWQQFGNDRPLWLKFALSNGEGRASANTGLALSYTTRAEWLPLGPFKDNGDYSEGDLAYEQTPKFSIGAVYNYNKNTTRVGGQLGKIMLNNEARNITTVLADTLLKYRGWAWTSEFAYRTADNPVIAPDQSVYAGKGFNTQLSYVFANHFAPAVRYTKIWADRDILSVENSRTQYVIGLTKYLQGHKIKLLSDVTYEEVENSLKVSKMENWIVRLQIELGI